MCTASVGMSPPGRLFALGLAAWQVLIALLVGITIVYFLCNLVARPSQATGTPYPVALRISFGVLGANIPAIIRGLIAVAGTASRRIWPRSRLVLSGDQVVAGVGAVCGDRAVRVRRVVAVGLDRVRIMWIAQAIVFWRGMESIRKFIDFCGPAVYVVMFLLAGYLVLEAGWSNIDFNLTDGGITLTGWAILPVLLSAIALVVSYFSGPMLNYGDFARYGKDFKSIKKGNFLGLPVNFLVFSLLVVVTAAATRRVFGELIIDPVHTVARLDNVYAVILGALTFMIATVGINIEQYVNCTILLQLIQLTSCSMLIPTVAIMNVNAPRITAYTLSNRATVCTGSMINSPNTGRVAAAVTTTNNENTRKFTGNPRKLPFLIDLKSFPYRAKSP